MSYASQISNAYSRISQCEREIENLYHEIVDLERKYEKYEGLRQANSRKKIECENHMAFEVRLAKMMPELTNIRLSTGYAEKISSLAGESRFSKIQDSFKKIAKNLLQGMDRVKDEIRKRKQRIQALQLEISSLRRQIASWQTAEAAETAVVSAAAAAKGK
jgi:chromosome segregation ATPase